MGCPWQYRSQAASRRPFVFSLFCLFRRLLAPSGSRAGGAAVLLPAFLRRATTATDQPIFSNHTAMAFYRIRPALFLISIKELERQN